MLYKPRYCCNCGEKIERVDWNLLTSRRFCDLCAIENRKFEYAPRIAVAGGILAAVFGLGSLFGSRNVVSLPENPSAQKNQPVQNQTAGVASVPAQTETLQKAVPQADNPTAARIAPVKQSIPAVTERKAPPGPAYFCGALTKKGTPCSRKVKSKGERCWQHTGMPSSEEFR